MGVSISRMDVIENQTDAVIEITEVREGCYGYIIKVQPGEAKEVAATKFTTRSQLSSRPSFLKIFVNGKQTDASLSPHHFIEFSKIVFRRADGAPQLTICGIRAKLADLRRIGWLGCTGRDYKGRQEETIANISFSEIFGKKNVDGGNSSAQNTVFQPFPILQDKEFERLETEMGTQHNIPESM